MALNNKILWNYHVAPILLVDNAGRTDTLVVDPSLDLQHPLPIKEWFAKIGNASIGKYAYLNSSWYFFNTQNNGQSPVLNGYFYDYNAYDSKSNLAVEKGLAVNDLALYMIAKYIRPLEASANIQDQDKLKGLKLIFGDVSVLENVFSKRISGLTLNTSLRYLFDTYPDILLDAYAYYDKRLVFWTQKTNMLLNGH